MGVRSIWLISGVEVAHHGKQRLSVSKTSAESFENLLWGHEVRAVEHCQLSVVLGLAGPAGQAGEGRDRAGGSCGSACQVMACQEGDQGWTSEEVCVWECELQGHGDEGKMACFQGRA